MWLHWKGLLAFMLVLCVQVSLQAKKEKNFVVTDVDDIKDFKKLLKSKTNILVLFVNIPKASQPAINAFKDTAEVMKGQATLVIIDCSNSVAKKLCKKLKIDADKPYAIKHYRNGDFHKDYDRSVSVGSFSNFLRDPTGDLPWEEDPTATDIFHLTDAEALNKFIKKGAAAYKKSMIMFYAPWCGYCKMLKPVYVQVAQDLKGEALLAAIDVAKPGNTKIRQTYNITEFPTLLYYEKGQVKFPYNGANTRQGIVDFIRDPTNQVKQKQEVKDESWSADSDIKHLTEENFDSVLAKAENALVVFYAPWCGHCKKIKPEFERAATKIKEQKINGLLAAVDATKEPALAQRFGVKGYPTLKYFSKGEYKYDAGHTRLENQIIDFIKEPKEAPAQPPEEQPWAEQETAVRHLDANSFRSTLRKIKHALVMFHAPWCSHCKMTKPEFVSAAEKFADELRVAFAAVDCTQQREICSDYNVRGYPTIKYFSYFDKRILDYNGARKEADFVSFIHTQMNMNANAAAKTNQEAGFGVNVDLSFDSDFESTISSSTPTFVMFYASFCGHCSTAKPAFSRLASTYKIDGGRRVKIIALDAAENPKTADFAKIETLPTFKMFISGKEVGVYEGDRSYEHMLAYCKKFEVKDEL